LSLFWSEERCREAFGAGDYREGWYLVDDDVVELDDRFGWEPLTHACARFENETVSPMPEPVLLAGQVQVRPQFAGIKPD